VTDTAPLTRTALYARISNDPDGDHVKVETQLDECWKLAGRLKNWTVVDTFCDDDISAYDGSLRREFERLLAAIQRGEIDAIVCWQPDRLYRSLKDLERLVDATERGIEIRSVNAGDFDLSNSTGRMLARILGSVARQESELKGERRVLANTRRAEDGKWRKDQPRVFGYTQDGQRLEPEATAVQQAITDVLAGKSLRAVANEWNDAKLTTPQRKKRGGGPWSNLTVRRALLKPCYAGLRVYRGEVVGTGDWEALIDKDTHDGLVSFLSDPSRRNHISFERKHQGSGIYICDVCGRKLYAKHRPMNYLCKPSRHVARHGEQLDAYVAAIVLELLSRDDIASRLSPRPDLDVAALRGRRTGIQSRLSELAAMFAAGEIDAAQLKRGTADLRAQMAGIDKVLAEAVRTSPAVALLDGDDLQTRWYASSPDLRGKIIDELMTVRVLPVPPTRRNKGFDPDYIEITPKC
jgi:site-specific DNA recombinase